MQFALFGAIAGCRFGESSSPLLILSVLDRHRAEIEFTRPDPYATRSERRLPLVSLLNAVRNAERSIEIWCYGFDEEELAIALVNARNKGVSIRITGSQGIDYATLTKRGFSVALRKKSGLLHAKLFLIDRNRVFFGTGNYTRSGFFHNNNAYLSLPVSSETAAAIAEGLDFESAPSRRIDFPSAHGTLLISPARGREIQSRIVQAILSARFRIRYMIYSHTDPVITAALFFQAQNGVIVEGIYDDSSNTERFASSSEAEKLMKSATPSLLLYLDGNRSGYEKHPGEFHGGHLHHKTMIIDDRLVLTGSYNWSLSARDTNLETYVEFDDPLIARRFTEEFERVHSFATLHWIGSGSRRVVADPLRFDPVTRLLCWNGPAPATGFTVFSGSGPFFRAEHYTRQSAPSGCIDPSSRSTASAGLLSGTPYPLDPDHSGGALRYQFDLRFTAPRNLPSPLPCLHPKRCRIASLKRGSISSGWFWSDGTTPFVSGIVWSRQGLSMEFPLVALSNRFYRFPATSGDLLLFLKDRSGTFHIACIQSGSQFSGPPAYFLNVIEREVRQRPFCPIGEP